MAYIGAVAAAAVVANAVKASGTVVTVEPDDFLHLVHNAEDPLIVMASGGLINKHFQYLMGYKGLAFFTKSEEKLPLPMEAELVTAKKITIPDL